MDNVDDMDSVDQSPYQGDTNFTDTLDIQVNNGTTQGTVQLQAAANGAGTLTIQPGASCIVQAQ